MTRFELRISGFGSKPNCATTTAQHHNNVYTIFTIPWDAPFKEIFHESYLLSGTRQFTCSLLFPVWWTSLFTIAVTRFFPKAFRVSF